MLSVMGQASRTARRAAIRNDPEATLTGRGIDTGLAVPAPSRSVVICCLPRTGSSLLGHRLYATGATGWPGEWFWREEVERNWTA